MFGLAGYATSILGLGRSKSNHFKSGLFLSLGQFKVLNFGISGFEAIEIEQDIVLIFYFFAHCNMIP